MNELNSLAWNTRAVLAEVVPLSCNCILCSTPFKIHGDDTLLKLMDLSVKPSPLAPLGSRPANGKRRLSSPAPLGPHYTVPRSNFSSPGRSFNILASVAPILAQPVIIYAVLKLLLDVARMHCLTPHPSCVTLQRRAQQRA